MAGHSQFKNIMHRKGAQDAKRAKIFTRVGREIEVAARTGQPDPAANPRLRAAILAARAVNMPKDRIDRAIKRASEANDGADYVEVRYEGFGPGGVAMIVEALTDNRNRTASDMRSAFSKNGGNLGESNSVAFMFDRIGEVRFAGAIDAEDMLEAAIEAGAQDVESSEDGHVVVTEADDLHQVREVLEARFGEPESVKLTWRPQTTVALEEEPAQGLFKLLEVLDDNDDVQNVVANFEVSDEVMARLAR